MGGKLMDYREVFELLLDHEGEQVKLKLPNINAAQAAIRRMITGYNAKVGEVSEDLKVRLTTTTVNKAECEYNLCLLKGSPQANSKYKEDLAQVLSVFEDDDDDNFDWSIKL